MKERFADKTVLVTGAASGIGKATAQRFGAEGATLVLADYDEAGVRAVAQEIASTAHVRTFVIGFDAAEPESCRSMVDRAVADAGGIDVLCNIAGIYDWGHFGDFPADAWERLIRIDLSSIFYITQRALPHLLARRGNVVNMASAAGLMGLAYNAGYCAAKAGVIALTKSIAVEFASQGLRANAVCPGGVDTPINAKARKVEGVDPKLLQERHWPKTGRMCEAGEVAAAVAYLASDEAANVTGIAFSIDGGQTAG
jgi:meso-butanediol dehydrogenase / (S,S)-butanediol dehydrogenase / diacetyl reductase